MGCVSAEDVNSTDSDILSSSYTGNFQELADLIDAADDGATMQLKKDYNGSGMIFIEKDLTINGNGHYIDANSISSIFLIDECEVTLNNIRFFNACESEVDGGALYSYGTLKVNGCEFYDNIANRYGGAIYSTGELYVDSSKFSNNRAECGCCIYASNLLKVTNSQFTTKYNDAEFIDYYDDDDETSGSLYLSNNVMDSPYPWDVWYEGDTPIKSQVKLEFVKSSCKKVENVTIANVYDDNGNTIRMDSINLKVYSGSSLKDSKTVEFDEEKGYSYTNTKLASGTYKLTGSVSSDYAKNCKVVDGSLTVNGGSGKTTPTVTTTSKVNGKDVTLTVNVSPSDATGTVSLSFNNVEYKLTLKNGKVSKSVSNMPAGTYKVKATYGGDGNYNSANARDISFTIRDMTPGDDVISAPDVEKYSGGAERFTVTLTGTDGKPIANGKVKITLNGQTYDRTTGDAGTTSIGINLPAGQYNATVEYDGRTVNSLVTVKSTMEGQDLVKYYRNDSQYYIRVLDTSGNPLAGKKVKFNINGVFYDRKIDERGMARLNINLRPDTYIITATNPANGEMYSNSITVLSTLIYNHDIEKYYKSDKKYWVFLLDGQGNPYAGQKVKFNINGVFYTRTTDKDGAAGLPINLPPNEYIITAEHNELAVSNRITVKHTLSGSDVLMAVRDGTQYKVRLINSNTGNGHANQDITFNINGVFYTRTTDSSGEARLNINLNAGDYIITATSPDGESISNQILIRNSLPRTETILGLGQSVPGYSSLVKQWEYHHGSSGLTDGITLFPRLTDSSRNVISKTITAYGYGDGGYLYETMTGLSTDQFVFGNHLDTSYIPSSGRGYAVLEFAGDSKYAPCTFRFDF